MNVLVLISGVRHGAASVCPRAVDIAVLCSREGMIFASCIWVNAGGSGEGTNVKAMSACGSCYYPLLLHLLLLDC